MEGKDRRLRRGGREAAMRRERRKGSSHTRARRKRGRKRETMPQSPAGAKEARGQERRCKREGEKPVTEEVNTRR